MTLRHKQIYGLIVIMLMVVVALAFLYPALLTVIGLGAILIGALVTSVYGAFRCRKDPVAGLTFLSLAALLWIFFFVILGAQPISTSTMR